MDTKPPSDKVKPPRKICGAKNRQGQPCGKSPMKGSNRCRNHGGTCATKNKGNTNGVKAGTLYSQFLTPAERVEYDRMALGTVDEELRLMRIRLSRALKLEQEQAAKKGAAALELEVHVSRDGGGPNVVGDEHHHKRRDYHSIIQATTARIESLEKTRKELLASGAEGDGDEPESRSFTYEVVDGTKKEDDE